MKRRRWPGAPEPPARARHGATLALELIDEASTIADDDAGSPAPPVAAADDRAASRRRLRKELGVEAACWAVWKSRT